MSHGRVSIAAAALVAAALVGSDAGAVVQSKCLVGKNKCVSKRADALLVCEEKAQKPGKPSDPNDGGCVDKAIRNFDGGDKPEKGCFENLEDKKQSDCVTFDDTARAAALVDSCVAKFVAAIDPPPTTQTKCGAGKIACVTKRLRGLLSCYRQAQTPNKPVDPEACLTKVRESFDGGIATPQKGCFAKLESKSKNDCLPPLGNSAELEDLVDDCVDELVLFLEGSGAVTTTTGPTATSSSSTSSSSTTTTSSSTTSTEASTSTTTEPTTTTTEPTVTTTTTEPADTTTTTAPDER
jgi:hypothetical protein